MLSPASLAGAMHGSEVHASARVGAVSAHIIQPLFACITHPLAENNRQPAAIIRCVRQSSGSGCMCNWKGFIQKAGAHSAENTGVKMRGNPGYGAWQNPDDPVTIHTAPQTSPQPMHVVVSQTQKPRHEITPR